MTDSASENTSFPLDIEQSEKYDFENLIKDFLDFWRFLVIGKFFRYSRVFKRRMIPLIRISDEKCVRFRVREFHKDSSFFGKLVNLSNILVFSNIEL